MWINQTMRIKIIIIQLFYKCIMVIIKKLLLKNALNYFHKILFRHKSENNFVVIKINI